MLTLQIIQYVIFRTRRRIITAENCLEKLQSIDQTLEKYKHCTTNKLVELTHKDNTPWALNGKGQENYKKISDKDILLYHHFEER